MCGSNQSAYRFVTGDAIHPRQLFMYDCHVDLVWRLRLCNLCKILDDMKYLCILILQLESFQGSDGRHAQ